MKSARFCAWRSAPIRSLRRISLGPHGFGAAAPVPRRRCGFRRLVSRQFTHHRMPEQWPATFGRAS